MIKQRTKTIAQALVLVLVGLLAVYGGWMLLTGGVIPVRAAPPTAPSASEMAPTLDNVQMGAPMYISFQGSLRDEEGKPLTGEYDLTFRIYDTPVAGEALWTEEHPKTAISNGGFAVLLGVKTAIPPGLFGAPDRYIGVSVDTLQETTRQRFASVPYAMQADRAAMLQQAGGGPVSVTPMGEEGKKNHFLQVDTGYGYVRLGPSNEGWAHFTTDRSRYYFDHDIHVDGGKFSSYNQADLQLATGGKTQVTVAQNGSVGIGTTSPTSKQAVKLDVRGNVVLETGGSPAIFGGTGPAELNRHLGLYNSADYASAMGLKAGGVLVSDTYRYANPGKNDLIVKGKVGIGTAAPAATLDVAGDIRGKLQYTDEYVWPRDAQRVGECGVYSCEVSATLRLINQDQGFCFVTAGYGSVGEVNIGEDGFWYLTSVAPNRFQLYENPLPGPRNIHADYQATLRSIAARCVGVN